MLLNTPTNQIPKIGPVYQKRLEKLGIKTAEDLIRYIPSRYEDFSNIIPIDKIKPNEKCCVCGKILEIKTSRTWQKRMFITEGVVQDKTAAVKAVWFNQPYLTRTLKQGDDVCLAGKVAIGKSGLFLQSPTYEKVYPAIDLTHTGRLVPIYPETTAISSRWLRYIIKPLLQATVNQIQETLPEQVIKQNNLLALNKALWYVHFPDNLKQAAKARQRLSFEELYLIQLAVLQQRLKLNKRNSPTIALDVDIMKSFTSSLGFKLTDAQRKCAWQILKDMETPCPMSRLLEGDVGSGKTVVAVMAALSTIKAGFQVAFMAPTEILVKQHFNEVAKLLYGFKIKIALLTGKQDKIISQKLGHRTKTGFKPEILEISRNKILEKIKSGEIDMLIGTHALIQDKVKFGKLALAIVDEQHRFGVKQRAKILVGGPGKNPLVPHLLSMTATPIPRTLALTIYGDLDLSVIDEMPKGRKKIITEVVPPAGRQDTYRFITQEIKKGHQVFVICPRIEKPKECQTRVRPMPDPSLAPSLAPNRWARVKAVEEEYEKLSTKIFPKLKVEMLHGKMKVKEKEKIMQNFRNQKFDILVATSVVEVGVDIPKATVMLIEGAEMFGLAQLHQFRGRVGRSGIQSYCFLFTDSPAKTTRQRLKAIQKAENGFELAEQDLKIRGPGSLYGVKQWGMPDLAMENLTNLALVEKTREQAKELLAQDPLLTKFPLLATKLRKFEKQLHLE